MDKAFKIGDIVRYYDEICKVRGFDDITGFPKLGKLWYDGRIWTAKPNECEKVGNKTPTILFHKDGLVDFEE